MADAAAMRVLIVMPSIPLQGMERSTLKIAQALKCGGARILVILEEKWAASVHHAVAALGLDAVRIPHAPVPALTFNPYRLLRERISWRDGARRIAAIARDFHPTHIHVTNISFARLALPAMRSSGACVVFRLPNPPDTGLTGLRGALNRRIWRRVLSTCDRVVCNSEYTARVLRDSELGGPPPLVIRNMVTRSPAPQASDAPRLDLSRFNVMYMGRIRPEKGVAVLLDAALAVVRLLPDVDFHLVGEKDWRNPFADRWQRRIENLGVGRRIRLWGEIEDVPGLIAQAQVHVCPSISRNESFPNVMLEAKSQGVPSIVFPVAGLPESVTHGQDGFVCREASPEALVEAIRFFHDQPGRCEEFGQQAKASLAQYDDSHIGAQWLALYRSCTGAGVGNQ